MAYPVIDHVHALAPGDYANAGREILAGIIDHVIATPGAGNLALFRASRGPDHLRAQARSPLAGDLADATGSGMDEDRLARASGPGKKQQVIGGQPLEQRSGGDLVGDLV